MDEISKYSREGYNAFIQWIPKAFNPYDECSKHHDEWNIGWEDARHFFQTIEEELSGI